MDSFLFELFQATDESEHQRALDKIILEHAAPIIKETIRQRLGFRVDQSRDTNLNSVGADLYHEAVIKLVERLNELQSNPGRTISNFPQYAARVAINICNDHLREKYPSRYRLKHKLRFLLENHSDFSIWSADGEMFAGFKDWIDQKTPADSTRAGLSRHNLTQIEELTRSENRGKTVSLSHLVNKIFTLARKPLVFEQLVDVVAQVLEIEDLPLESLDNRGWNWEDRIVDQTLEVHSQLVAKEMLLTLWLEIERLPKTQRQVFCLTFEDDSGSDLVSLLVDKKIRSLEEIAEAIEIPLLGLSRLWPLLPLENRLVAIEMGATPEKVSKWRHRAVMRMRKIISALWNYGAKLPSIIL